MKILKIKAFQSSHYKVIKDNSYWGVNDYTYNVYLFGVLIHSVKIYGISYKEALQILKGIEVIKTEQ